MTSISQQIDDLADLFEVESAGVDGNLIETFIQIAKIESSLTWQGLRVIAAKLDEISDSLGGGATG